MKILTAINRDEYMNFDLIRASELKSRLIEFAYSQRFKEIHDKVLNTVFADMKNYETGQIETVKVDQLSPEEYFNFLDWFALELKHTDGRSILDYFIEENKGVLSEEDALALDCWRNVFESTFKVKSILEDGFHAVNLFNLKEYIIKPTVSIEELKTIDKNSFINARIVPYKNYHIFSGAILQLGFETINDTIDYIVEIMSEQPALYFQDNNEGVAAGFLLQKKECEIFKRHFGDEIFVCEGYNLKKHYEEFYTKAYPVIKEMRTLLRPPKSSSDGHNEENNIEVPHGFDEIFNKYRDFETVAMIYDDIEGINFYPDFDKFQRLFSGDYIEQVDFIPAEKGAPKDCGEIKPGILFDYLKDESISPLVFKKMYERYPGNALLILSNALNFNPKDFNYDADIEKYLFTYKSYYYKTKPIPSILPVDIHDFIKEIIAD